MMLTCPNCAARYLLAPAALGPQGRDVRCAKCDHEWFAEVEIEEELPAIEEEVPVESNLEAIARQLAEGAQQDDEEDVVPSDDDIAEEAEEEEVETETDVDPDSIPNSVKPIPDDFVPARPEDVLRPEVPLQARMAGYGGALALFCVFVLAGFLFKNSIVTAWQPAALIYEMAGMPVSYKGEGLVVESLSATILAGDNNQETLVLKGRVINLTGDPIDVPEMVAVLRSTNGEDGEKWIIDPPVDQVAPGASFAFTSDYPAVPRGVGSVNLTFVPTL